MPKLEKAEYVEEWKLLTRLEGRSYQYYNKTILLLASGAFVLSIYMLFHMSGHNYLFFIVYAWLFWIITVLLQLAAFSLYPKAIHQEKLQLEALHADHEKKTVKNFHYDVMQKLSLISTAGFGMGIFFFVTFVLFNLNCF